MTISNEAVTAAARSIHDERCAYEFCHDEWDQMDPEKHGIDGHRQRFIAQARAALEAAAPLMHTGAWDALTNEVTATRAERDQARLQAQSLRGDLDRGEVVFRDTLGKWAAAEAEAEALRAERDAYKEALALHDRALKKACNDGWMTGDHVAEKYLDDAAIDAQLEAEAALLAHQEGGNTDG